MIRDTLSATQAATFAVCLPRDGDRLPVPSGTGFFVSPDGWFVTAVHVIVDKDGVVRSDLEEGWLNKEMRGDGFPMMFRKMKVDYVNQQADIALIRVDTSDSPLDGEVQNLMVSRRVLVEAEPVYAFGYPLSQAGLIHEGEGLQVGHIAFSPRTTSAIVSSTMEFSPMVAEEGAVPEDYVLDKALNYGNSGGPIVAAETGRVHAVCTRFQPNFVPQEHLAQHGQDPPMIMVPSLYGVVSSLGRGDVMAALQERNIPLSED